MWLLRRLKQLKLGYQTILAFYLKHFRPFSEYGVVVWNSGLTKNQSNDLKKIQKVAFKIILGDIINTPYKKPVIVTILTDDGWYIMFDKYN